MTSMNTLDLFLGGDMNQLFLFITLLLSLCWVAIAYIKYEEYKKEREKLLYQQRCREEEARKQEEEKEKNRRAICAIKDKFRSMPEFHELCEKIFSGGKRPYKVEISEHGVYIYMRVKSMDLRVLEYIFWKRLDYQN